LPRGKNRCSGLTIPQFWKRRNGWLTREGMSRWALTWTVTF